MTMNIIYYRESADSPWVGIPAIKGEKGEPGEAGSSPVRGVDYWTEDDKAEIKSYVEEAILGGAW